MSITLADSELVRFFLAITLLLLFAHICGFIFSKLKMPKVIGEIIGGVILGPSLLGFFFPEMFNKIFLEQGKLIAVIYWLGLVLLMFCSGFEVEPKFNREDRKTILWITLASTIIPFICGWWITSLFDLQSLAGTENNILALRIIVSIAIAVTSIPVISKIFFELDMIKTRFAKIILATATIHDILLYVALAVATALVSGAELSAKSIGGNVLITIGLFALAMIVMPKVINLLRKKQVSPIPKNYEFGFVMGLLLLFVVIASYLKINVIFGAFLAGIVVAFLRNEKFQNIREQVKEVSFALFIPIYFAIVGLKIDLIHSFDFWFFLKFTVFAVVVQGLTVLITSRLLKYTWLSSFNLAVAMNARGGPGIVLATIAFDLGIISESFFVTLVIMAIVTSLFAGMWLKHVKNSNKELLASV